MKKSDIDGIGENALSLKINNYEPRNKKFKMMSFLKQHWWLVIIAIVMIIIPLLILGSKKAKEKQDQEFQAAMVMEVKKNEGRIEKFVRSTDWNKKVNTITIDYSTVKHNPMGAIMVNGYVNNNKKLEFNATISNNYIGDKRQYYISGGHSAELGELMHGDLSK